MLKRLIAGTLSAIICTTAVLPNHLSNYANHEAKAAAKEAKSVSGDYDIKSTNSLGNFFKSAAAEQDLQEPLAENACNSQFQITSLEFDNETEIVRVASTQQTEAKIVVSFINDDTSENVLSVETKVEAGRLVNSELIADASKLPQYYLVKAQLFDSLNRPVGKSYTLSRYTKEFQEILATDINDFEQEQVVNLDEDETTNFLVLNEDTVKAESSEEQNTLVSADYDNNVFVFENADESITSLENGEYLYIQPDEDNIIAVNVEKIEKDGDTVTVSGNDDIEDMFDFIKIESEGNISKAQIDTSAADDGVSFPNVDENGDVIVDDDGTFDFEYVEPQHDINFEFSSSKTISLDGSALINNKDSESDDPRPNDPYEDTEVSTNVKLSGSITFSVNFNFYKTLSTTKIECVIKITPSISFSGGFSIYNYTDKDSLPSVRSLAAKIAEIIIPTSIPLADLVIFPRIFFELSGKINLSLKWVNIIGFAYNDGVFTDKTELFNEKNIKAGFSLEGELYTGLELQIYAEVINKKTASFGLDIKAGLRVKAEADLSGLIKSNKPQDNVIISVDKGDSYHACSFCVKFTTDFVIKCNLELYILGKKKEWNLLEISVKLPFLNGYISAENGCGFGECNYKRYRVKFHDLTGSESDYLPAVITIGDKKARVTSKDTIFYCLPGSYSYDVSYNGESLKSGSITVSNSEIYIPYIQGPEHSEIVTGVPYIPEEIPKHEMEDLSLPALSFDKDEMIAETGALGDHISYMLYPDGYLYACGYGEMYDFISSPFRDPSIVKYAVIENTGDEKDGGIITSIGNNVFVNCSNMESINLPTTIDRIGVNAFANCSLFSKVSYDEYDYEKEKVIEVRYPEGHLEMPKAVTTVEAGAFSGCSSFTDINIPETVIGIGSYAFSGCTGITSIEVPDTVRKIGEFVFNSCTSLEKAVIKGGEEGIGGHIFNDCVSLTELTLPFAGFSKKSVDDPEVSSELSFYFNSGYCYDDRFYKFYNKSNTKYDYMSVPKTLKKITILGGTRIPSYAFYRLSSVETIIIPDNITEIGDAAFYECSSMKNVPIPSKVVSIGNNAFSSCTNAEFKDMVLPNTLISIGDSAFSGCNGLTSVTIPEKVKTIGGYVFSGCTSLEKAVIKGGEESIGGHIFNECVSLTELTLPFAGFSKKSVDNPEVSSELSFYFNSGYRYDDRFYKFYNKSNTKYDYMSVPITLKKITILGGTRIPNYAFFRMSSVKDVYLPKTAKTIADNVFSGCSGIENVFYPGTREEWEKNVTVGANNSEIDGKVRFLNDDGVYDTTTTTTTNTTTTTSKSTTSTTSTASKTTSTTSITSTTSKATSTTSKSTISTTSIASKTTSTTSKTTTSTTSTTSTPTSTTTETTTTSISTTSEATEMTTTSASTTSEATETTSTSTSTTSETTETTTTSATSTSTTTETTTTSTSTTTSDTTTVSTTSTPATTTEPIDYTAGDVDNSGTIDAVDASYILAYYARVSTNKDGGFTVSQKLAADIDGDGQVNSVDASYVLAFYVYVSTTKEDIVTIIEFIKKK